MSRFFVDPGQIRDGRIIMDDKEDVRHLTRSLRYQKGDIIEISDGCHFEYEMEMEEITQNQVLGKILEKRPFTREPSLEITLYQAIPKQAKMEVIVQKAVELGVGRILPLFTQRTVVSDEGNLEKKRLRWQKVAQEAAKQCGRGRIPQILLPKDMDFALSHMKEQQVNLFFYEEEQNQTIKEVLRGFDPKETPRQVGIIIGPEGGFSPAEAARITSRGAFSVSMGKRILRVETASAAALAMVLYEWEL